MENNYLHYLNKMVEESNTRVFTKDEINNVNEALKNNLNSKDAEEALNLASLIVRYQSQISNYELLHGLINNIIYHGESYPDAEEAVFFAKKEELIFAAKFIDEKHYDEFEKMREKGFDPFYESSYGINLMNFVKTLSGAEYMEQKGLIPDDYFTMYDERDPFSYPPLYYAYPEQIDFYISHGADVNAVQAEFENTVLDAMLYASRPVESLEKIYKAGGVFNNADNNTYMILERLTDDYDNQIKNYGEESIKRNLDNLSFLIKESIVERPKKLNILTSNPELFEKYPDTMKALFPNDNDKDLKIKIANIIERKKKYLNQPNDLLTEKQEKMEKAFENIHHKRPLFSRSLSKDDPRRTNWDVRKKTELGKTGDYQNGEVREEHKLTAYVQKLVAKKFMKKHDK